MSGPAGRLDAVVICGGQWHDFDYARLQILTLLADHEVVRTRVFDDYAGAIPAIDDADLLITYTCNRIPDEAAQRSLTEFLARGGRWLALHATNSAIEPTPPGSPSKYVTPRTMGVLPQLVGSQFLGHPPIAPYRVEIAAPDHPLVAGVEAFYAVDELYVSELFEPIEVLAHTRFVGESTGFAEGTTPPTIRCRSSTSSSMTPEPSATSRSGTAAAGSMSKTWVSTISDGSTGGAGRCRSTGPSSAGAWTGRFAGRSEGQSVPRCPVS
ncbi:MULTISPECIES: ThuA domain-containing protein [Gordonia]|uniref:ThuA domain-containing protein n=1 Tax=Gordonia TaxID=2053 RepID=UPI001FFABC14|nr:MULTISPECIES: ThuA domain-containing protein [Gordonia]MCT1352793.1 ThuA domain-containing protein [Gordonia sp. p3-SID1431]UPG68179.1 ThuA domain-containing protein [Gordonia hongkongensis]